MTGGRTQSFKVLLSTYGKPLAVALDAQRDPICEDVTARMRAAFPALCYDPLRADAEIFQETMYHETPRRFHRVLQTMLRLRSISVLERQYRWAWGIVQRYGVEGHHLVAQARWYFDAAHNYVPDTTPGYAHLNEFELIVRSIVEQVVESTNYKLWQADHRVYTNGQGGRH